ncbi:MAG: hypothetical protein WKG07_08370 [Hymenobacter sp.]
MEQTETDLVNKRLTEETILRQQQILTRMLEVEKPARERDQDTKREAQTARNPAARFSRPPSISTSPRLPTSRPNCCAAPQPVLTPYYQQKVGEYFQKNR